MLTREEELTVFRGINGKNRIVTSPHSNIAMGNTPREGFFNQGVSRVKLREFVEKEGLDFEYWKNLNLSAGNKKQSQKDKQNSKLCDCEEK